MLLYKTRLKSEDIEYDASIFCFTTYIRKVMNQNHWMTEKTFTSTSTFAYFLMGYL